MSNTQSRRRFRNTLSLAGAFGILSPRRAWPTEPGLETTTVRLGKMPVICFAPQYVCEVLLRADGFTDVRYVDTTVETQAEDLGHGKLDFQSNLPLSHVIAIDRGLPITVVTGVHAGCYELFAIGGIRGNRRPEREERRRGCALAFADRGLCRARSEKGPHTG
jgi:NitT/TauT family transport system substrate-binding protein